jgi:transposase
MAKPNLKSQAKRKRELAKKDKRQAKDEKRALRKAERTARTAGEEPSAMSAPEMAPQPSALSIVSATPRR